MSKRDSIFKKSNILVTGGAGFIGSHLCERLLEAGNNIICIDNLTSGDERNIDHLFSKTAFRFIRHDILEPLDLESIKELEEFEVKFHGIQEIYHLACPTSPRDFEKFREETALVNSLGLKNILDVARKYSSKFLLASSSVIYGPQEEGRKLVSEDEIGRVDHLSQRGCYDEGKRFAEMFASLFGEKYYLDVKIARIFRTYGPKMKLGGGEFLPEFFRLASSNEPITLYGNEKFYTSLCYVEDVVDGLIKYMKGKKGIGPINIGSDVGYLLKEIAEKMIQLLHSSSTVTAGEPDLFISPLPLPDISKAKQYIGWLPITTFDTGLKKTVDYFLASKNLLGY